MLATVFPSHNGPPASPDNFPEAIRNERLLLPTRVILATGSFLAPIGARPSLAHLSHNANILHVTEGRKRKMISLDRDENN